MILQFERLCSQIFYYKNKFQFPFEEIHFNGNFQDILNSSDYPLLEKKMKNLIDLLNQDSETIYRDVEELWDLI